MAIAPQNEDAFFREVNEEVRRDQLTGVWRRYGARAVALLAVALLALAAWLFWQHRQDEAADRRGEALSQALGAAGSAPAAAAPQLAAIAGAGDKAYALAARIAQAGLAAARGDTKGASAGFAAIAADTSVPQPFRNLAVLRQTTLDYDTLAPGTVVARLAPFAAAGNPWFGSAAEMTAIAYLKQGKQAEAARLFAALAADRTVPDTIRARAARVGGMLGADVPADRGGTTTR